MQLSIVLSWPVSELSPNKRLHPAARSRYVKAARKEAWVSTLYALNGSKFEHDGKSDIILKQIAHPPANYRYDRDGIDARLKAHRDGIADALGVNDRHFRPLGIVWADGVPGGKIVIEIEQ